MFDALTGYRGADPYPRQSREMVQALDDADDLKSQIPALTAQIAVLEALAKQVRTYAAEDVLGDAINSIQDEIASLRCGADKALDDCED